MASHNDLGTQGELLAQEFLTAKGYTIIEKNYRIRRAEIDLIAIDGKYLVVVEVKTRTKSFLAPLSQAITPSKINLLIRAANYYVQRYHINKEVRFDVVSVLIEGESSRIEHLVDAFYHF